jgi:hypothetical protein
LSSASEAREGTATHILVAGNVTLDRTPQGGWAAGGPSLYTAQTARALGVSVTLITGMHPDFDQRALAGLDVRSTPAAALPRYANTYDHAGNRTQLLLSEGEPLALVPHLRPGETPDAVLFAPAYHEFRRAPLRFRESLTGIALQGALRSVTADQRVIPHPEPLRAASAFARPGWIAFFSDEDTPAPEALARHLASEKTLAILTRGHNGATLFELDGTAQHWPALPATPVDPTGAGDCFASAFMVRLAETDDLATAMRFALAAGALAVEHSGIAGLPTREAIEARMNREAA